MKQWAIYSIIASAAFGLSAIPLKIAVGRGGLSAAPEIILLTSCLGSLVGAVLCIARTGNGFSLGADWWVLLYGGVSGLISIIGSLAIIKALGSPSANVSNVMSLVNTNMFFTVIFSIAILGELPSGAEMIKTIIGAGLIFAGAVIVSR